MITRFEVWRWTSHGTSNATPLAVVYTIDGAILEARRLKKEHPPTLVVVERGNRQSRPRGVVDVSGTWHWSRACKRCADGSEAQQIECVACKGAGWTPTIR